MVTFITVLIVIFVLAAIAAPIVYTQIRRTFRQQKNFERGLKMVPLLIHLPPSSDDTEENGRDVRDLIDENVSRAEVLYGIIASTLQKGFKSSFYGQRHFSLEIIGSNGFVYFYAAVPIALVEVVQQAIVSAYPSARLDEVAEHNIFSPVGKLSGTIGGELSLKENYAYPIATYQDIKRDAMQSLLNSLFSLQKEDGVGIQILMRPASPSWRAKANAVASSKRKGGKGGKGTNGALSLLKDFSTAFVKPPEHKDKDKPQLSNLEQSVVDSIEEKTKHPAYEVLIRVVASSNVSQRAQGILKNVVASFSLYDAPGKNGFKFTPAKDIERFVTAYILRMFPQENNKNILNARELATLFHFPDQKNIPTSQLERQASKQVDGPRNIPETGILLGYNLFRGVKKPIRLSLPDRQRHMYVVGQTGTGKSTFLENLALQDMLNGEGFAYIDPHGDTAEKLLSMVPRERTEDVIYFCPAEMEFPMGLNLFEFDSPEQKDFLIQEVINMLYKLYDPQRQGIIGPRYEHIFRNCALLLMADPRGGTFIDIPKLLIDGEFMKEKLKYTKDQTVLDFWTKEFPQSQRSNEAGEVTSWVVSKFGAFLSNEMMRNIIGQIKSSFNLREIMDNKKILIVNLSKGRTGELNSKLLGMIFVMKFQAAAMSRANIPESQREDFCLYVDEFQNFSTDSFATIMSEARKYHLNLIVANQFTTQLSDEVRDAVFGNMGTIVSFRIGQNDVESLSRYFKPLFDGDDLLRVPNYNTIVRTLVSGVPTQPFSMAALPPLGSPNEELMKALKQLSSAKFGRSKLIVEQEINERLRSPEKPKPAFNSNPFANPSAPSQPSAVAAARPPAPKPAGAGSFMDEWLAKRGAVKPSTTVPGPVPSSQPGPAYSQTPGPQTFTAAPAASATYPAQPAIFQQATQAQAPVPPPSRPVVPPFGSGLGAPAGAADAPQMSMVSSPGSEAQATTIDSTRVTQQLPTYDSPALDSPSQTLEVAVPAKEPSVDEKKSNPVAIEASAPAEKRSAGELRINGGNHASDDQLEDTIFIDREGNFQTKS